MTYHFISKETRNSLVEYVIYLIKKTGFSDEISCFILRITHIIIPLLVIVLAMTNSKYFASLSIIIIIIVDILFLLFNGCILTIVERKLSRENYTLIDPLLNMYNVKNTNSNRRNVTKFLGGTLTIAVLSIYIIKFT